MRPSISPNMRNRSSALGVSQSTGRIAAFDQSHIAVIEFFLVLFAEFPASKFVLREGVAQAFIEKHNFVMLYAADWADVPAHSYM